MKYTVVRAILGICVLSAGLSAHAEDNSMGFFVTSAGLGKGADLGGLKGADAHCTALASAAGAKERKWVAYLSTEAGGKRGISARDRIGSGPWYNANGVLIAKDISDLHLYNRTINKETALDENGQVVNGRGDKPNRHDLLTGSQDDGTAYFPDDKDHTCNNWTSSSEGAAQVGHHDRHGGGNLSWASAHSTRGGCSQDALKSTGGAGLFYCFSVD